MLLNLNLTKSTMVINSPKRIKAIEPFQPSPIAISNSTPIRVRSTKYTASLFQFISLTWKWNGMETLHDRLDLLTPGLFLQIHPFRS